MSDEPRRLLEDGATSPLARSLLDSARGDGPSAAGRAAAAKHVAAAVDLSGSSLMGGKLVAGKLVTGKLIAVAVMVAVGSGAAALIARVGWGGGVAPAGVSERARESEDVPEVPKAETTPEHSPPPVGVTGHVPYGADDRSSVPKAASRVPVGRVARVAQSSDPPPKADPPAAPFTGTATDAKTTSAPATAHGPTIADELALVDSVRSALSSGNTVRALELLDAHAAKFPRGTFEPEAAVLRIEVLLAAGDRVQAAARAEEFLAAYPRSALAARVRTLLATATRGREGEVP